MILTIFYCVVVAYQITIMYLPRIFTDAQIGLLTFFLFSLPNVCGITNAILFVKKNTPSRKVFVRFKGKLASKFYGSREMVKVRSNRTISTVI